MIADDILGKKFSYLKVLKLVKERKYRHRYVKCKCDCGNTKTFRYIDIKIGKTKSCGCKSGELVSKKISPSKETTINKLFVTYRREARRKKQTFTLSLEEFRTLILSNCFYCGTKPYNTLSTRKLKLNKIFYSGLDRVNNSKGYQINNVVPCCIICNRCKSNRSLKDFLKWVEKVYKNRK